MDRSTHEVEDFNIHWHYSMTDKMDKIRKIQKINNEVKKILNEFPTAEITKTIFLL